MNEPKPRRPLFWPAMIMTAFGLGAVLWSLWMVRAIRQTRENRTKPFFVPMVTNATYSGQHDTNGTNHLIRRITNGPGTNTAK